MRTLQEGLAEFVSRRMRDLGLSTYDVAHNSGGAITHQTVWSVANNQTGDIKLSTIFALARGLRVPSEEVFDAAREGRKREMSKEELRAANYFRELPADKQQDALLYLETLHAKYAVKPEISFHGKSKKGKLYAPRVVLC